jgi:UDP-N-acetylmuramate dehydrogenase
VRGDVALAADILRRSVGARLREGVSMAALTTFRIGGPAALYLEPDDESDLRAAAEAIARAEIPYAVLGKGSNVLVSDAGFPGLVVRLGRGFRWAAREGNELRAGGSMPLPALAGIALQHGLAGLAFAIAIPATLGGAVRMNAGAHGGQMSDVVGSVRIFRLAGADGPATIAAADAGFGYRHSELPADAIVTAATMELAPGDAAAIRQTMDEARRWRRDTQPVAEPNCGSVFTNPPGEHAAALIEAAGCKGERIGGATVSAKHANFIVAEPGATAADVLALIELVRSRVAAETGVWLTPEVQMIGGGDA